WQPRAKWMTSILKVARKFEHCIAAALQTLGAAVWRRRAVRKTLPFFDEPTYGLLAPPCAVAMAAARECWVQSAAPGHDGGAVHVAWDPGTATVTASQWRVDAGDEAGDVRLTRCGPPASVTLPPGSE